MQDSFTLLIGAQHAMLVPPHDASVNLQPLLLSANTADAEIFRAMCRASPTTTLQLIIDFATLQIERIALPPLGPRDRHKLIQRHRAAALQHHSLAAATLQARQDMLLAMQPPEAVLSFWLDAVADLPNPIAEMMLTPLELAALLPRLSTQPTAEWQLLLVWQQTSGLRQIVTRAGNLVVTRLTPPPQDDSADLAVRLEEDGLATLAYLQRIGMDNPAALHVTLIAPPSLHETLSSIWPDGQVTVISPHDAAERLGLPFATAPEQATSDLLLAGFVREHGATHPAEYNRTQPQRLAPARLLRLASVLLWLGLAAISGWQLSSLLGTQHQLDRANAASRSLAADYKDKYAKVAALVAPLETMRLAAMRQALFERPNSTLRPVLERLRAALSNSFRLQEIHWQGGITPPDTDSLTLRGAGQRNTLASQLAQALPDYELSLREEAEDRLRLELRRRP